MINVRSQNRMLFVRCSGFMVNDSDDEYDLNYYVKGILSSNGKVVTLGFYHSREAALRLLDAIESCIMAGGNVFEMSLKDFKGHDTDELFEDEEE